MIFTAILDINHGQFTTKMKMKEVLREIRIPLYLPLTISLLQEPLISESLSNCQILVFEWKKHEAKYTHRYTLKEIE